MPCYSVQRCAVDLNHADHGLLTKALEALGYKVVQDAKGQIVSFTKGRVTGTYDGTQLHLTAPNGVPIDSNAIMHAYSKQVMQRQIAKARKAGWDVVKTGPDKYKIKMPPGKRVVQVTR